MIGIELDHPTVRRITCDNGEDFQVLRDAGFGWTATGTPNGDDESNGAPLQLEHGSEPAPNFGRPGSKAHAIREFVHANPDVETPLAISRAMKRGKLMKVSPQDVSNVLSQLRRKPR